MSLGLVNGTWSHAHHIILSGLAQQHGDTQLVAVDVLRLMRRGEGYVDRGDTIHVTPTNAIQLGQEGLACLRLTNGQPELSANPDWQAPAAPATARVRFLRDDRVRPAPGVEHNLTPVPDDNGRGEHFAPAGTVIEVLETHANDLTHGAGLGNPVASRIT